MSQHFYFSQLRNKHVKSFLQGMEAILEHTLECSCLRRLALRLLLSPTLLFVAASVNEELRDENRQCCLVMKTLHVQQQQAHCV